MDILKFDTSKVYLVIFFVIFSACSTANEDINYYINEIESFKKTYDKKKIPEKYQEQLKSLSKSNPIASILYAGSFSSSNIEKFTHIKKSLDFAGDMSNFNPWKFNNKTALKDKVFREILMQLDFLPLQLSYYQVVENKYFNGNMDNDRITINSAQPPNKLDVINAIKVINLIRNSKVPNNIKARYTALLARYYEIGEVIGMDHEKAESLYYEALNLFDKKDSVYSIETLESLIDFHIFSSFNNPNFNKAKMLFETYKSHLPDYKLKYIKEQIEEYEKCYNTANQIIFNIKFTCANEDIIKVAIRKLGGKAITDSGDYQGLIYDASTMIKGATELSFYKAYEERSDGISEGIRQVYYGFDEGSDAVTIENIINMVSSKYGTPTYTKGQLKLGYLEYQWNLPDKISIYVYRTWPKNEIGILIENEEFQYLYDEEKKKQKKAKQAKYKDSQAF